MLLYSYVLFQNIHSAAQCTHMYHSFIQAISVVPTQRCSQHSMDTMSEFHAKVLQATASEGLAQGPYLVARVGFEPTTLRMKGIVEILSGNQIIRRKHDD